MITDDLVIGFAMGVAFVVALFIFVLAITWEPR